MRETLTDRFFAELEDDSPSGQSIPTIDDYGRALDIIHAREAAAASVAAKQEEQDRFRREIEADKERARLTNDLRNDSAARVKAEHGSTLYHYGSSHLVVYGGGVAWPEPTIEPNPIEPSPIREVSSPYQANSWVSSATWDQDITGGHGRRRVQWGTI